jgi:predicted dehydrogenase
MPEPSMQPVRIGVIGAGWWAALNHIPLLKANPRCSLVAVSRPGAAELDQLQRTFDIPFVFEDYSEMLDAIPLDGVIIASPHVLHYEHALAALAKGCHVLVEKPLATSARDAREILVAAEAAGREVVVAYGWNFRSWVEEARILVSSGAIGRVEHVVLQMASPLADLMAGKPMKETEGHLFRPPPSTWADPQRAGGYGWGQLSHALGLLFRITDLAPRAVFATFGRSPTGVDYYDAAVLYFAGGATASLSGASTVPKQCGFQLDLRLFGDKGMLLLDIERERLELHRHDGEDRRVPMRPGDGAYSCEGPVAFLVDRCCGREVLNAAPGMVAARAVDVLDAMYRSAVSGKIEDVA